MPSNVIQSDDDLFGINLPTIEPDGQIKPASSAEVQVPYKMVDFSKEKAGLYYSLTGIAVLLFLVICLVILKKWLKNRNPMAEYTKQQTKKMKQEAYVSSTNKLETPDSLTDCIRSFLERTK